MSDSETTGGEELCPVGEPWQTKNHTGWRAAGEDRVCRYCGSWHPQELRAWLPNVDGLTHWVELNDHGNKVYVHRPDIQNASGGAIKFRVAHIRGDEVLAAAINRALRISGEKSEQRMQRWRERIDSILQDRKDNNDE